MNDDEARQQQQFEYISLLSDVATPLALKNKLKIYISQQENLRMLRLGKRLGIFISDPAHSHSKLNRGGALSDVILSLISFVSKSGAFTIRTGEGSRVQKKEL